MTWDKVMKLRNRIRIFAVIFILALGMEYLPMAVYAAEVTAEESDMANDAEPDMDETPEPDNASETDKEDKNRRTGYGTEYTGNGYRDIRS